MAGPLRIRTGFLFLDPDIVTYRASAAHPGAASAPGQGVRPGDRVAAMIIDRDGSLLGSTPGLPDEAFESDGLITKRAVRAVALAQLRPLPGQLLWDVGTGAGSIAIEWCRGAQGAKAIGLERRAERAERALRNADRLTRGGSFSIVLGEVADSLPALPAPDAVFVGGGGTMKVLEFAMSALNPGGRLVAHGITLEAEELCVQAQRTWGGQLMRVGVEIAEPLGSLSGWRPLRTVISWAALKD